MERRVSLTPVGEAPKPENGNIAPTADEVSQELDRILQSTLFQRSERLQRFLRFVCAYEIRGEGQLLHEYLIGSEVFGRGEEYSTHEDGIVRRQAHALRRKLQEYYEKEGMDDPIRIELPVGRYVPSFRRHSPPKDQPQSDAPAPQRTENPPVALEHHVVLPANVQSGSKLRWVLAGVTGLVLFAAGWVAGTRTNAPPSRVNIVSPEEREIWGAWLDRPEGASLCFSNPLTTVVKHYPEMLAPDSQPPRQLLSSSQEKFFRSVVPLPPGGFLYFAPTISQAKMGEAFAGVYVAALFARAGLPIRPTQSRFVSWEDLTRENIILLGHNEANPWLDRILKNYPMQLAVTKSDRQRAIVNARPGAGETGEYRIRYGDETVTATEEYALISMLPGADARHLLLLISGLNTQATQSAAEYLTTSARLKELAAELRKLDPSHNGPWHFQAVLRTEVHDRVPTKAVLVNLKVIKQ